VAPRLVRPAVAAARRVLRQQAVRRPSVRRAMEVVARELTAALDDDVYGAHYFGQGRDASDRAFLSGYERYDRDTSNANVAAYLVWRHFPVSTALDVGCATGFVVEALRELGIDAKGVDVSRYAVEHPARGAAGHLRSGNLLGRLPYRARRFELVTAFETLEHLPPTAVPRALRELRRVTSRYVVATIPSFGPNPHGPGGWFEVKVPDHRLDHYYSLGPGYEGPVPFDDLNRDAAGNPLEGHLTIASFSWWTARFEEAGFVRCGAVERRMHPDLARYGMTKYWNLYVFRLPSVPEPGAGGRSPDECREVERRFGLDARVPDPADLEAVAAALGTSLPRP
jgi:SAM-dependent methyltransferase